jgi:regulatory protein
MARHKTGAEARAAREARLERHAAETDPAVVMNAAARFLELRSRSVHEVTRNLTMAGFPTELVEGAVARLLELGLLDDTAYARAWVESRDRSRPRGQSALRRELSIKGIDRETIAATLAERGEAAEAAAEEGDSGNADSAAADRLLAKSRAALLRIEDPRARRSRAYALLARNGFDPDVCREVSAQAAGLDEGADD